ncbi:UNVERIFIED_CONTAM: hypothetical protein FKN15_062558 [Acipenser sinensis]
MSSGVIVTLSECSCISEPPAESSAQDAGLVSAVQELKPEDPIEVEPLRSPVPKGEEPLQSPEQNGEELLQSPETIGKELLPALGSEGQLLGQPQQPLHLLLTGARRKPTIIDNIIEESQKEIDPENALLTAIQKEPVDQSPGPSVAAAELLHELPELLATEKQRSERSQDSVEQNILGDQAEKPGQGIPQTSAKAPDAIRSLDLTSALVEEATENSSVPVQQGTTEEIKEQKKADILEHVIADDFEDTLPPAKPPRQLTLEPDIVASTKRPGPVRPPPQAGGAPPRPPPPARPAPPPRKKKSDLGVESQRPSALEVPSDTVNSIGLVSPNTAIECITKDLQHSLDLASATSGDKVVTAQIIDNIIEESQKEIDPENALLTAIQKEPVDQSPGPSVAAAELLHELPELLATEKQRSERSQDSVEQNILGDQAEKPGQGIPQTSAKAPDAIRSLDLTSALVEEATENSSVPVQQGTTEEIKEQKKADILEHVIADDFEDTLPPAKPPRQLTLEPDIVASTKRPGPVRPPPQAGGAPPRPPPPARPAPPPRKKKSDLGVESQRPSALEVPSDTVNSIGLVSPNTAIECITKDLQHSLDLASATSGDKVVTAQENGKAADGQSSTTDGSEVSGPQRPRSNSGRELTDEEILASVMIKNLDTGEEIPLSLAEEKLPTGINPLTLHIMRRTKEYVTNDAAQSDDEDKSQSADTDGGKLKQKTTQFKKFLGKSVKRAKHLAEEYGEKAVNKVKSVRDEVFHTDQDDPSSSDDEGMPYTRPVKFKAAHGFKGPFDFDQIKVVQDLSGEHMIHYIWVGGREHLSPASLNQPPDN